MGVRVRRLPIIRSLLSLGLTAVLALGSLPTVATAGPNDIPAGFDAFITVPEKTSFDFSETPIPADFFAPGSEPFDGIVLFGGVPIDPFDPHLGDADTLVQRMQKAVLPPPFPTSDTVPIELVQLSLRSSDPITVTYPGGSSELWDVHVQPSPTGDSKGKMTITKTHANGGTFDSSLLVLPLFTFVRPSDGETRTLDVGALGLGSDFLKSITLKGKNVPWQHKCPKHILAAKKFCPSVRRGKKVLTEEQARLAKHGIKPAQPFVEIDRFPVSFAKTILQTPQGSQVRLVGKGPTTVHVMLTELADTDGDGLEQVPTEMVDLQIAANHPLFGPINIHLNPDMPTLGEIEETQNTVNGRLDLPPFAPEGTADSFFDVFFEVDAAGTTMHNNEPKHMSARITRKPPNQGEVYEDPTPIDLFDPNNNPTGFRLLNTIHIPDPEIEIDHFPLSFAKTELQTPQGSIVPLAAEGPTTVHVKIGAVGDFDGDGLDQVDTEMVALNLTANHPLFGPINIRLNPSMPTVGEIEETQNTMVERLDLPPFAPEGTADSFFDVFFEVEVLGTGQVLHNNQPKHMSAIIRNKPPAEGDTYEDPTPIDLFDPNNNPTGYRLLNTTHVPNPRIETDPFPNSQAQIVVEVPTPQGPFDENVQLSGPTTIEVLFENVADRDADGLEEVPARMTLLDLTGSGPNLGPVQVRLRDPSKHPFMQSVGYIEENGNTQEGRLDLPPFAPSGQATSFFDVFFEIEVQNQNLVFHNDAPKRMQATITRKPPAPGETYFNELLTILLDENEQDSGKRIKHAQHTPIPAQQEPPPNQNPYCPPEC